MFTAVGAHRRAQSRKASSYIEHYAFRSSCVCSSVPKTHSGTCLVTCPWIQGHTSMLSSQRHVSVKCATCVTLAHTGVQTSPTYIHSDFQMFTFPDHKHSACIQACHAHGSMHTHTVTEALLMSVCTGLTIPVHVYSTRCRGLFMEGCTHRPTCLSPQEGPLHTEV